MVANASRDRNPAGEGGRNVTRRDSEEPSGLLGTYIRGVRIALRLMAAALVLSACTHGRPNLTITPGSCSQGSAGSQGAGITGSLHHLFTAGPVSTTFDPWAESKPHSGAIVIADRSSGGSATVRVPGSGAFAVGLAPGTYRVTASSPGVHMGGVADAPLVTDAHTVRLSPGQCATLRLLVYEQLP
jgi:hypothetical protein